MKHGFLGWDVGAWHGKKDALVMLVEDLDTPILSGNGWEGGLLKVYNNAVGPEGILWPLLHNTINDPEAWDRITIAIDAPLGWPAAMLAVLDGKAPRELPERQAENRFLFRTTERWLSERGHRPLSAVQDMIGSQATKAMAFLVKLGLTRTKPGIWTGMARNIKVTAIETYPSPCGLSPSLMQHHARLLDGLTPRSSDVADALTCALVAWTHATSPRLLAPPIPEAPEAEGWIWVPKDCLAHKGADQ